MCLDVWQGLLEFFKYSQVNVFRRQSLVRIIIDNGNTASNGCQYFEKTPLRWLLRYFADEVERL